MCLFDLKWDPFSEGDEFAYLREVKTNGEVAVRIRAISPFSERVVEIGDPIYAGEELKVDIAPLWPEGTKGL
jgi:hypothetical protein